MNNHNLKLIEESLYGFLPPLDCRERKLIDAMRYSLEAGGKRVRPLLVMEFNALCGGKPEAALPFACAVEMVHTYSLIHDDLPCMDDDDLRRGKPSNHKVYGEDTALLAGDALLTLAFDVLSADKTASLVGDRACRRAVSTLSRYAGCVGMVGGQVIDLASEHITVPIEVVEELVGKKTACLIQAACELGCLAAGADEAVIRAASDYGRSIGYAFQIQDDILDCTSTDEVLGKPVGSDEAHQKSTYVSLLGIEKARALVHDYTAQAIAALNCIGGNTKALSFFAMDLAKRVK